LELVDTLEKHIVPHYNTWQDGLHYRQTNQLYLVLKNKKPQHL